MKDDRLVAWAVLVRRILTAFHPLDHGVALARSRIRNERPTRSRTNSISAVCRRDHRRRPAGLAASLTTVHRGLTTLVIEAKDTPGGQPQFHYANKRIVDIAGFPDGITGDEISARVYRQAADALVQLCFQRRTRRDRGHRPGRKE